MEKNKVIIVLVAILFSSNSILLFLLYRKRPIAPTLMVAFEGKSAIFLKDYFSSDRNFWNNYPYVVMTTEGQLLDTSIHFTNQSNVQPAQLRGRVIYRLIQNSERSAVNVNTLKILQSFPEVVVITDSMSLSHANERQDTLMKSDEMLVLSRKRIKNQTEKIGQSYMFFLTKGGKMINIYYPRIETPEITTKYLNRITTMAMSLQSNSF